ncbi:hypothetical protein VSR82_00005, partial [Burkholderia sp. JPY481]
MQSQVETPAATTDETVSPLETNFGNEQLVATVAYSSLRPSPLNARTKPLSNIPALAASIRAKGLLQINRNLSGCYIVVAVSRDALTVTFLVAHAILIRFVSGIASSKVR